MGQVGCRTAEWGKLAAERPSGAGMFTMSGNSVTAIIPLPIFSRRSEKAAACSVPDRCALMLVVRCFTVACCQWCDFLKATHKDIIGEGF